MVFISTLRFTELSGKEKGKWRLMGAWISTFLIVSASPLNVSNSNLQGQQGRMLDCWRLSACVLAPHSSSQMPCPLGHQQPEMLLLLACCRYSELLQTQQPCLVELCMSMHISLIVLFSLLCYFNLERRRSRFIHLPAFLQSISIPWVFLRDPLFQNTVALSACFRKSSWKSVWVNSVPISSFQE